MRALLGLALVLTGCSGEDTDTDLAKADPCGGGANPTVALGRSSNGVFSAFEAGDGVVIVDSGGQYGFFVEMSTENIATEDSATVLLRVTYAGSTGSEDALGSLPLQCDADGVGWTTMFATLPASHQDATSAATLVGTDASFSLTVTDADGRSANDVVSLTFEE